MTFTIDFGWWIIPAIITVSVFFYAFLWTRGMTTDDRYGAGAVITLFFYVLALAASLLAWLIWSLAA